MKKLALLCITALGAALLVIGSAPAASAYPELTCSVSVVPQTVNSGEKLTVTGENKIVDNGRSTASSVRWTFTFNGVTKKRTGATASATFTAPQVTKARKLTLNARSTSPDGTCERDVVVTVIGSQVAGPTPAPGGGLLPNTGGPMFWLLVGALALLLVGGGTVVATRRRD